MSLKHKILNQNFIKLIDIISTNSPKKEALKN